MTWNNLFCPPIHCSFLFPFAFFFFFLRSLCYLDLKFWTSFTPALFFFFAITNHNCCSCSAQNSKIMIIDGHANSMSYVNGWTLLAQFRLNAFCAFDQSYRLNSQSALYTICMFTWATSVTRPESQGLSDSLGNCGLYSMTYMLFWKSILDPFKGFICFGNGPILFLGYGLIVEGFSPCDLSFFFEHSQCCFV